MQSRHGSLLRRGLIVGLVGAGIASATLGLRDSAPVVETRRTSTPTSAAPSRSVIEAVATVDIKGHAGGTIALGFSGEQLVTAGADHTLKVWTAAGALQRTVSVQGAPISAMATLSRRAVTAQGDGTITLWDLDRGDKLATFRRNDANIWAVAFAGSPDRVVAASHDWTVSVWDTSSPSAPTQLFEGHESAVQAVAFAAAKGYVASGGADRQVKLWQLDGSAAVRTYRRHTDFITAVEFSGDGRLLASAALDGSIRVWSTASNRLVATLNGHRGRVAALAFAPSGEMLASVGDDGSLRLWDAKRGRLMRLFAGSADAPGGLRAVAFSAHGRLVAAAGDTGAIKVRELDTSAGIVRAGRDY